MPTRRDQIQSYQFVVQRVVAAFVARDPHPAQSPLRRLVGAGFGGFMIAVLLLAGFGVYGLLRSGGKTSWQDGQAVIVERETGAHYVYRGGVLYPVANLASGLLLVSGGGTVQVSRESLLEAPRGPLLGVPGLPDALPPAKRLVGPPWTLCSEQTRDSSGRQVAQTVLTVGGAAGAGRVLGDDALLAVDEVDGRSYLVWRDRRYEITDPDVVGQALALDQQPTTRVGNAWLHALPAGRPVGRIPVSGRGETSEALADARVGQVFVVRVEGVAAQYYLAMRQQLRHLTELEANVVLADPATKSAYDGADPQALALSSADATAAPKESPQAAGDEAPPGQAPRIVTGGGAVCAAFSDAATIPQVLVEAQLPVAGGTVATARATGDGVSLADRVWVRPGHAALVEAVTAPEAGSGTWYLVTDVGVRHAITAPEVLTQLGYGEVRAQQLPVSLVVRLPEGPPLDPESVQRPVPLPER